jgi:hypothetical protein
MSVTISHQQEHGRSANSATSEAGPTTFTKTAGTVSKRDTWVDQVCWRVRASLESEASSLSSSLESSGLPAEEDSEATGDFVAFLAEPALGVRGLEEDAAEEDSEATGDFVAFLAELALGIRGLEEDEAGPALLEKAALSVRLTVADEELLEAGEDVGAASFGSVEGSTVNVLGLRAWRDEDFLVRAFLALSVAMETGGAGRTSPAPSETGTIGCEEWIAISARFRDRLRRRFRVTLFSFFFFCEYICENEHDQMVCSVVHDEIEI